MRQLGETSVGNYMKESAIVVDNTARLTDAIRLMDDSQVSALPVVDQQGRVVGILASSDLIEMVHEIQADLGSLSFVNEKTRDFILKILIDQGDTTRVMDVMTAPVETVSPDCNLVVAAGRLNELGVHQLPVTDSEGCCVGVFSSSDLVRAVAEKGALAAG